MSVRSNFRGSKIRILSEIQKFEFEIKIGEASMVVLDSPIMVGLRYEPGSECCDDADERLCVECCAAYQAAINVGLGKEGGSIGGFA